MIKYDFNTCSTPLKKQLHFYKLLTEKGLETIISSIFSVLISFFCMLLFYLRKRGKREEEKINDN